MARVNINILGISELKWTGMGEFISDDHSIYYCGLESLRRNRVALIVNKNLESKLRALQPVNTNFPPGCHDQLINKPSLAITI